MLSTLPPDRLTEILNLVDVGDIYRLWKCGTAILQQKMRLAVHSFQIGDFAGTPLIAWPLVILNFKHLSSLEVTFSAKYRIGDDLHNRKDPPHWSTLVLPLQNLAGLPLRCLILRIPSLNMIKRHMWRPSRYLLEETTKWKEENMLKMIFPRLQMLKIATSESPVHHKECFKWSCMPSTLTDLSLLTVSFPCGVPVKKIEHLLPGLIRLNANIQHNMDNMKLPYADEVLLLNLGVRRMSVLGQSMASFPSLKTLKLKLEETHTPDIILPSDLKLLPSSLTELRITTVPGVLPINLANLQGLPPALTILRLDFSATPTGPLISFFRTLPRQLAELSLSNLPNADNGEEWADEVLDALPKSLTKAPFLHERQFRPAQRLDLLLPSLKYFSTMDNLTEFHLPTSITELDTALRDIDLISFQLPRLLTLKGVLIPLSADEGSNTAATTSRQSLRKPRTVIPPSVRFPGTLRTLEAWVYDNFASAIEFVLEEEEDPTNAPSAPSTSGSPNQTISHPPAAAAAAATSSSPHHHFQHLSCLKLSIPKCTLMTFGGRAWPASLKYVKFTFISGAADLSSLLPLLPSSLTLLSVDVNRIDDNHFQLLPRGLKHLTLWWGALAHDDSPKVDYQPSALANLPPNLETLRIVTSSHFSKASADKLSPGLFPPTLRLIEMSGTRLDQLLRARAELRTLTLEQVEESDSSDSSDLNDSD